MTTYPPLDWAKLGTYAAAPFPHGWNPDEWLLMAPRDPGVHQAILDVLNSAAHSVYFNDFGFTDVDAATTIQAKCADPNIVVVGNLDSTQESGPTEKALIQTDFAADLGTSIAVGRSIHSAISHLKVQVVDALYVI